MSVNDAIGRLSRLFVVLFALLAVRQLWVQVVAGPRLSRDPRTGDHLHPYRARAEQEE